MSPILTVRSLEIGFAGPEGEVVVVDGVDLDVVAGQTTCLVGESGCGKTLTALSILRLLPEGARWRGGSVVFRGRDLARASEAQLRAVRGNEIAMVFQEPATALNPVYTVGEQIAEVVRLHLGLDGVGARRRAVEMLARVGIPEPGIRVDAYPHELSGGMRQRAMIAMAIACDPAVLIADEPTTALDVTVQADILELLKRMQRTTGMAILFITHDLGVVAEIADRVSVLYAGRVVERAGVEELFERPRHPYTAGLLESLPERTPPGGRLRAIPGRVPAPWERPEGCRYRTRCELARGDCERSEPLLAPEVEPAAACHFSDEVAVR